MGDVTETMFMLYKHNDVHTSRGVSRGAIRGGTGSAWNLIILDPKLLYAVVQAGYIFQSAIWTVLLSISNLSWL